MKLTSLREIKLLLQKNFVRPAKSLGQHFLIDKEILRKIIETADLKPGDTILEIGPGIGTLTLELAKRSKKVIAIEKDRKMVEILKEILKNFKNVEIINKDILRLDPKPYTLKPYKIVANLPYYITSPVIRKFLECNEARPRYMVLMVQKEVAQRICAKSPDMSLLAVSVQFYAKPEIISYVSKKSFWPSPKVDSAILKISAINQRRKSAFNQRFFKIVKAGFSQPRKQILNNLSRLRPAYTKVSAGKQGFGGQAKELALSIPKGLKLNKPSQILQDKTWTGKEKVKFWLEENKIKPTQRAESLSIEDWINLTKNYKKYFK